MLKHRLKLGIATLARRPLLRFLSGTAWLTRKLTVWNEASVAFAPHGFHLLRHHYYLPIPEPEDLAGQQPTEGVGIDWNEAGALALLRDVIVRYVPELADVPVRADHGFHWANGSFMAGDAHVYHALLRHHRPRRVVEIGSGYSALVATRALRENRSGGAPRAELTVIEPFPGPALGEALPEIDRHLAVKVQAAPLEVFTRLEAGDVLFIDSTHTLRQGGDVAWEYCEILPRLAPGVLVHVHDVPLPDHYSPVYAATHRYWTEQYVLQALLAHSTRYRVIWPAGYLRQRHAAELAAAFAPAYQATQAVFPGAEPGSFWMQVR